MDVAWLAPDERERLARMRSARRRTEALAAAALRRCVVSGRDRPTSASHSGGHAALLVGPTGTRVGVDLELVRDRDALALAAFTYAPEEHAELAALAADERRLRFHALWTLKEAFVKALGLTLVDGLRTCTFSLARSLPRGSVPTVEPWCASVRLIGARFVAAAVCIGRADVTFRLERLDASGAGDAPVAAEAAEAAFDLRSAARSEAAQSFGKLGH